VKVAVSGWRSRLRQIRASVQFVDNGDSSEDFSEEFSEDSSEDQ
jgi:hypothetical protein